MTNQKQQLANQKNASKSTGPRSASGKARASRNALRHGILSTHLILPDESREEFDALFSTLVEEMRPAGTLETALVERIAVSLWRQRRLVRAETASVRFQTGTHNYTDQHRIEQLVSAEAKPLVDPMLQGATYNQWMDEATLDTLEAGLAQLQEVLAQPSTGKLTMPASLVEVLTQWAADDNMSWLDWFKANFKGPQDFIEAMTAAVRKHRQSSRVAEAIAIYRDSRLLPGEADRISRYQATLDNELYKALKALREAQAWRERYVSATASVEEEVKAGGGGTAL